MALKLAHGQVQPLLSPYHLFIAQTQVFHFGFGVGFAAELHWVSQSAAITHTGRFNAIGPKEGNGTCGEKRNPKLPLGRRSRSNLDQLHQHQHRHHLFPGRQEQWHHWIRRITRPA